MKHRQDSGFSIVEIIIGIVLLGIITGGIATAFDSLIRDYARSRELTEIYTALSGCPEIDRALQFDAITSTNCSPNDTFDSETALGNNDISYTTSSVPKLTTDASLATGPDPVYNIPDSKVIDVSVNSKSNKQWKLRLLITRNGIGQQ